MEEQLNVDHGRMIAYVKQTEPIIMQGGDISRVDQGAMENLLRSFHATWKQVWCTVMQSCALKHNCLVPLLFLWLIVLAFFSVAQAIGSVDRPLPCEPCL